MPDSFEWLEPWYAVADLGIGAALERQIALEVGTGHVLHGKAVRLVARRADTDDALFALPDGRLAEVHMTWRTSPETDPRWPATAIYTSMNEWIALSMQPLHARFER
jgi:hypothetical protein